MEKFAPRKSLSKPKGGPILFSQRTTSCRLSKTVAQHIEQNGHLPDIPSAATVAQEGISLGAINTKSCKR